MSNQERSVLEKIKLESDKSGLVGKSIVPTEIVFSIKDGKRSARDKVIYTGYVFIETSFVEEVSHILKDITGSTGFVRNRSGEISPLKDEEVQRMFNDQTNVNADKPVETDFIIGEGVTIIGGPFETFKGSISELNIEKKKAKVTISIFSRINLLDVELHQIKRTL